MSSSQPQYIRLPDQQMKGISFSTIYIYKNTPTDQKKGKIIIPAAKRKIETANTTTAKIEKEHDDGEVANTTTGKEVAPRWLAVRKGRIWLKKGKELSG